MFVLTGFVVDYVDSWSDRTRQKAVYRTFASQAELEAYRRRLERNVLEADLKVEFRGEVPA